MYQLGIFLGVGISHVQPFARATAVQVPDKYLGTSFDLVKSFKY